MINEFHSNLFEVDLEYNVFYLREIVPNRILSYPEINFLIQTFRSELPMELFYRDSKAIFISELSSDLILEKLSSLKYPETLSDIKFSLATGDPVKIDRNNAKEWKRFRAVISELFATHLRRQGKIVELRGSQIYQTTFPEEMEEKEQIEIWPGFSYQFIIDTEKIYLLIDPKSRLNTVKTLREIKKDGINLENFIDKRLKDICCVRDLTKCKERMSSYSRCQLGGTGRTVCVVQILDEAPSDSFDVTAYLDEINCPTGVLKEEIEKNDKPPTISAYYSKMDKNPYKFPLERLAPIPKFELIKDRKRRQEFNRMIQPLPNSRYIKTLNYQASLRQVLVKNCPTIAVNDPLLYVRGDNSVLLFDIPDLLFKNNIPDSFASYIKDLYPYDTPKNLSIKYISEVGEQKDNIITDLKQSMKDLLSLDLPFDEITWDEVTKQKKGSCNLVLLPNESRHQNYNENKLRLVKKQISLQKITLSTITSKNKAGHLKNVCLGLFVKSGGIPWKIALKDEKNRLCIGWKVNKKVIPRRGKQAIIIFSAYTDEGIFIKSFALTTEDSNYKNDSLKALTTFISECLATNSFSCVDIHRDGDFYSNLDDEIINKCKETFNETPLHFISITEGTFRIYERSSEKYSNPSLGTTIKIFRNKFGMATTYIPKQAKSRTQQTIFCNFAEEFDFITHKEILRTIFNLTSGYHGYTRSRIKNPVTIHSVKKIFEVLNHSYLPNGFTTSNETEFFV